MHLFELFSGDVRLFSVGTFFESYFKPPGFRAVVQAKCTLRVLCIYLRGTQHRVKKNLIFHDISSFDA